MTRPTIAVAVIVKNEGDRIGRLLKSVEFADEVVVVDSGSTDKTCELCEKMGARVLYNKWPGYALQKQFAMEQTTGEWILNLDGDEAVSKELWLEIEAAVKNVDLKTGGFSMPRLSWYLGRWIRHGGWYPDRKIRLVKKGKGQWVGDALHEKLDVDGKIVALSKPILHYVYRDISDQVRTINRFSDIYAFERIAGNGGFVLAGVGHALGKFLECYVWKLGILDGIAGLVIAMNSAWYIFLKHAKSWEKGIKS